MDTSIKKKWYDKKSILISLLFLLPTVGIVGIFLHKTELWKKLVYTFVALAMSLVLLVIILAIFNPINYYESGNGYFENGNYQEAIKEYKKVDSDNEDYQIALQKIQMAQNKLDSISNAETLVIEKQKQDAIAEKEKLTAFQKQWADSIVQSWKGEFIISSNLKSIDTIQFELSKGATEIFNSNVKSNLPMYQSWYEQSLKYNLGLSNNSPKTIIEFIPNQKMVANQDTSKKYVHPSLAYYGIKVYSGNEYYKEYFGTVSCFFTDKSNKDFTDGNRQKVIIETNKGIKEIPYYKFRNSYWIEEKDNDPTQTVNKCN